jgi:hypothetical protein
MYWYLLCFEDNEKGFGYNNDNAFIILVKRTNIFPV